MSQIKVTKTRKSGKRKENAPKSSAKGKSNQINAENSRARSAQVTTPDIPTKDAINGTLERLKSPQRRSNLRAKPITFGRNASAWVRLMGQNGVTRTTLLNCMNITRSTYRKAIEYPSKYLTLHDLFFLPV